MPWGGHPQGAPLPFVFSRRYALGRAPTRGAPTICLLQALCLGEGTHKGRPYHLSSLGVMPWGGHPQGAPLPFVFSRRYALGRARGAPHLSSLGVMPGGHPQGAPLPICLLWGGRPQGALLPLLGGRPQGAPLPIVFSGRYALGRAPTRGAPTNCLLWALCPGEGAHKGAPTAPNCLLWALCPEKGAHKGRPYQLSSLGVMPWGGRPQGAPLPIVFSGRYALRRAPTRGRLLLPRGAPTNCLLWALCPGEGAHKGRPYQLSSLGVMPWGGHPQGAPLPDSGSLTWVCPNLMQLPCRLPARKIATRPVSTTVSTRGVVVRNRRSQ